MHRLSASFVLGYHGCDADVAERLLKGEQFKQSQNDYDWLGTGVYFWETNPLRGLDFAKESAARRNSTIKKPAVIGAVIDLGLCLDLTTLNAVDMVMAAYESLSGTFKELSKDLPTNGKDLLMRRLDCAVVNRLHLLMEPGDIFIDTVRGIFTEGEPVYPGSGFYSKTHTQIAVRNLDCIKGVFRVSEDQLRR